MLKKFLALGCVVALSAAFVGCEPAPVVDSTPSASDVTAPADAAAVHADEAHAEAAPAPAADKPAE